MKEIKILETTKVLSDREADLLCSILWSLGIYPEITALERKNRNITLASILPEMQPRTEAVYNNEKTVYEIFGNDKVRSCMFASVSDIPIFQKMLEKHCWNPLMSL